MESTESTDVVASSASSAGAAAIPKSGSGYSVGGSAAHFFEVRLGLFDGPIDLLLHLVKKNELSIEKVSLAQVAAQYLQCLEYMQQIDLEVAGEYLVIAATLLSIKSAVLLNQPVKLEIDADGNVFDPHEKLLRRLREAQVYKQGAFSLSCRTLLGVDVFDTAAQLDGIEAPPAQLRQHDAMLLAKAFQKILSSAANAPQYTITFESVSIVDRMMKVIETLRANGGRAGFEDLIPDRSSRASIVASFVALLELCKRAIISVKQEFRSAEDSFGSIAIVLAAGGAEANPMSSESFSSAPFTSEFDENDSDADVSQSKSSANG